jgi:hypothetical protein
VTVFVVFHNDIENSKWVRGVCSTREIAERLCDSPEQRYEGFPANEHSRSCCDVYQMTVDDPKLLAPVVLEGALA